MFHIGFRLALGLVFLIGSIFLLTGGNLPMGIFLLVFGAAMLVSISFLRRQK